MSTKEQFLARVKSADIGVQINNEGVTVQLYGNGVGVSNGTYRDKGIENGKPSSRRECFANVWLNQHGRWACLASLSTLITR